jgi:predicted 3-demethylubiquinone-9 3-methyltransferase (glyoxalase superfamily)
MQRITPNVWCRRTATEQGDFYASVLPGTTARTTSRYPTTDLPDFQRDFAGEALVVDVTIGGYLIRLINAGDEFAPNPSVSFALSFSPNGPDGERGAHDEIDRVWSGLSDGGEVRMPLADYPYSPYYGWIADRYGVNWQLMLTPPGSGDIPPVVPQLLFTGEEPRAREAIHTYTNLIPDSAPGRLVPWTENDPALMFADFTLAGQTFAAMDGGPEHDFTFSPGISLQVDCPDQAEIDRLWEALSAVPEAEACGWLVDRFGVSWQIVPEMIDSLLQKPDAYQHMLGMKKLVIADF